MAFFRNDAVNRINIHYGVHAFAYGAGSIFVLAYLLKTGVPVPVTLAAQAAMLVGRFLIRPLVLPLGKRFGLKPLVIAGALMIACEFPLLAEVRGVDAWLAALCVVASAADTLYWSSYHAYFASLGDPEHRGHQIGAREAIGFVTGVIAPLVGAWALTTVGPKVAFAGVALVQAASALPLLGAPNVAVPAQAPGALRAARLGLALFVADGWFSAAFNIVWSIVLFVSLSRSIAAFGGAMALAALAGAIVGLALGRHVDRGGGRRVTAIAYVVAAGVLILRALSLDSPWLAVAANAAGAFVGALVVPALYTALYNLAKASPCTLRFHIATEGAWDVGAASACFTAAGLAALGLPLSIAILLALPATAISAWMLRRYYAAGVGDMMPIPVQGPMDAAAEPRG